MESLPLDKAIVQSIQQVCEKYSLNCSNICNSYDTVRWSSVIEPLGGRVQFLIPFRYFESSLENGIENVSILVAFADLISKEENKGMAENMIRAKRIGAPYYYTARPIDKAVRMFLPPISSLSVNTYSTLDISYTRDDTTGEYTWTIPDTESLYRQIMNDSPVLDVLEPDSVHLRIEREISAYTGLENRQSSGIPVMEATQSARELSIPAPINSDPSIDG